MAKERLRCSKRNAALIFQHGVVDYGSGKFQCCVRWSPQQAASKVERQPLRTAGLADNRTSSVLPARFSLLSWVILTAPAVSCCQNCSQVFTTGEVIATPNITVRRCRSWDSPPARRQSPYWPGDHQGCQSRYTCALAHFSAMQVVVIAIHFSCVSANDRGTGPNIRCHHALRREQALSLHSDARKHATAA